MMSITRLVRTALYCFSVITVILVCIPFIKWEEMEKNTIDLTPGPGEEIIHNITKLIENIKTSTSK